MGAKRTKRGRPRGEPVGQLHKRPERGTLPYVEFCHDTVRACEDCGKPYAPTNGRQKRCPDCATDRNRENARRRAAWKRALERELKPQRTDPRPRTCLSCGKVFDSDGPGNRICPECRSKQAEVSPHATAARGRTTNGLVRPGMYRPETDEELVRDLEREPVIVPLSQTIQITFSKAKRKAGRFIPPRRRKNKNR